MNMNSVEQITKSDIFAVRFDQTFGTEKWHNQTFSTKKMVRPDLLTDLTVLRVPNCDTYYHKVLENQAKLDGFNGTRILKFCYILRRDVACHNGRN